MKLFLIVIVLFELVSKYRSLEIYWNIPSFMCKRQKIEFFEIASKYGIRINNNDEFRGEVLSILYDPGMFPALLSGPGNRIEQRNGGVPQEGNLTKHLEVFKKHVDEMVPDVDNKGLLVIDFESWRPIFRQNFGALSPYKDLSIEIERNRHYFWTKSALEAEAEKRFEKSGREFVEETIKLAKNLRPSAKWGYYAFPYCFNKGKFAGCESNIRKENDRMGWMFFHEDIVLPSVYLQDSSTSQQKFNIVNGRIIEAVRTSKSFSSEKKKVYVYMRYVYTDSLKFLSKNDLMMVFQASKDLKADGVILWGSSYDLNSRDKCENFQKYFTETMGPIVESFSSDRISVKIIN